MNYEFSLNKTAVISLIAGSVVFGVLLFAAGLVVGAEWLGTTAAETSRAVAKNEQAEGPKEPVLNDEEAAPKKAAPKNADQKPATPKQPGAAPPEDAPPATEKQAAVDGSVQIIAEAETEADAGMSEPEYVTVQVGVFQDQNEANRLLKDIERKGYAPSFFSGRDAEARQWYAVRIGAYSDRQQATNAAANFTRQEKMKAVVRPLGSL
ncbi:MAG TPA: SPOR domain-containing protein [Pyrinomonadaceae bacterium]